MKALSLRAQRGPKAHDEAVLASPPFAENVHRIVELRGPDLREVLGFQDLGDEAFARCGDGCLILRRESFRPHPLPFRLSKFHCLLPQPLTHKLILSNCQANAVELSPARDLWRFSRGLDPSHF